MPKLQMSAVEIRATSGVISKEGRLVFRVDMAANLTKALADKLSIDDICDTKSIRNAARLRVHEYGLTNIQMSIPGVQMELDAEAIKAHAFKLNTPGKEDVEKRELLFQVTMGVDAYQKLIVYWDTVKSRSSKLTLNTTGEQQTLDQQPEAPAEAEKKGSRRRGGNSAQIPPAEGTTQESPLTM